MTNVIKCQTAADALAQVAALFQTQTDHLKEQLGVFLARGSLPDKAHAYYPQVAVHVTKPAQTDVRASYGYLPEAGYYTATLTRPDIFHDYYLEQLQQLITNYHVAIEVSLSDTPIPLYYVMSADELAALAISSERHADIPLYFDVPGAVEIDDPIVDGAFHWEPGKAAPLALFSAPRVDYSLVRLKHYTGTDAGEFQDFVIFTNYQFYVDQFIQLSRTLLSSQKQAPLELAYTEFVTPDTNVIFENGTLQETVRQTRGVQMPAYHLKRANNKGITLVNIGVGPSNAKTITDHIAVLRPDAWLMLGHCGGLDARQKIGDYVLAHTYVREDHVLNEKLPLHVPIPNLAEMEIALKQATVDVTHEAGYDIKKFMRTGAVLTTADRNWEIANDRALRTKFSQTRAIAVDMESATIAANGYRYRVPYGTLLCVSDKPLHGMPKLPGMSDQFYQTQRDQHLLIGLRAMEILINSEQNKLHSRKLRGPYEPAFR